MKKRYDFRRGDFRERAKFTLLSGESRLARVKEEDREHRRTTHVSPAGGGYRRAYDHHWPRLLVGSAGRGEPAAQRDGSSSR
jgi:hypothetical protein